MTTQTHTPAATAAVADPTPVTPVIDAAVLLRRLFYTDAATGVPVALAFLAFSSPLERVLGLPSELLVTAGIFLALWGVAWFWVARTRPTSVVGAAVIITLNLLWVGHSVAIAAGAWFEPTAVGVAVVAGQAMFPAGLVLAQLLAAVAIVRHRRQRGV